MTMRNLPDAFRVAFSFAGEQRDLVRSVAEEVERILGKETVFFDEWFEPHLAGSDADLKLQAIYSEKSALVVFCISSASGSKPWTLTEHEAIRARQMKARVSTDKRVRDCILPIRVGDGDVEGVLFNAIVPDIRKRSASESAALIVERLRLVAPNLVPSFVEVVGPEFPRTPPLLAWSMADHVNAREAFGALLSSSTPQRLLLIRGDSETGKSHISRQMLANALAIPAIACGRFDFKGSTDMDREVRVFIQELRVPQPPAGLRLHERLDHVLIALRKRAQPTLLIFDTYEMAGETQEWVEKQLLPCLIRANWLRVVITGQKVPDPVGAVWAGSMWEVLELEHPLPLAWFDYGKQHQPSLTLAEVETVCYLAANKPSLLAQLLGPVS